MLKALIKKQLLESFSPLFLNRKTGKAKSVGTLLGYLALYVLVFFSIGFLFFEMLKPFCMPLNLLKLDWLYFSIAGILSISIAVILNVFTTFSSLYETRDNEFLLSLPIKPIYILISRIFTVFLWGIVYSAIVFIPCVIAYFTVAGFKVQTVVTSFITLILITMFVMTLSLALGYIVGKINSKLSSKTFIKVFAAIVFIIIYYAVYFKANDILQNILNRAVYYGEILKTKVLPLYFFGNGALGDLPSLAYTAIIVTALLLLALFIVKKSFFKIITVTKSEKKKAYKKEALKKSSVSSALLRKEFKRFTSSANYVLNCAPGTILMPLLGIFLLIKRDAILFISHQFEALLSEGVCVMIVSALFLFISATNGITAPSVSLEGKNIWILQSLPIKPWDILKAKIHLHLILTLPSLLICLVCAAITFNFSPIGNLFLILIPLLFTVLQALFGLFANLLSVNLTWTNEVVPIKQSLSTFLSIFGSWGFVIISGVAYYLVRNINPYIFLTIITLLIIAISLILVYWLKNKGAKKFARL